MYINLHFDLFEKVRFTHSSYQLYNHAVLPTDIHKVWFTAISNNYLGVIML